MSGFRPFTHFQTGTEYVAPPQSAIELSVSFERDADYVKFAKVVVERRIKLTLPYDKRLPPWFKRGKSIEIGLMNGQYTVTGKLLWRRLNVALIEGYMTKNGG